MEIADEIVFGVALGLMIVWSLLLTVFVLPELKKLIFAKVEVSGRNKTFVNGN
jgi:hypothetical protein